MWRRWAASSGVLYCGETIVRRSRLCSRNIAMFAEYLDKAMQHAQIEQIEDGSYFGSIPGFQGVWSNAADEDAARQELREVLEGWILLQIADHTPLPTIDGLRLEVG